MKGQPFAKDSEPRSREARADDGQALVEYTLVLMLVALAVFGVLGVLGGVVDDAIAAVLAGF